MYRDLWRQKIAMDEEKLLKVENSLIKYIYLNPILKAFANLCLGDPAALNLKELFFI